jgi:2-oxoglutarate dehydrogenase E2 component (dihydrolipoamide succinyltransferase)
MSMVDLVMPKLGESIMEATILKWFKKPGDKVEQDETILEIATDKVDSEVPSTSDGIITEILFNENDIVPIGKVIARIQTESHAGSNGVDMNHNPTSSNTSDDHEEANLIEEIPYQPTQKILTSNNRAIRFYSPLVLNIAASEGISMSELESLEGTGQDGRVSKKDIMVYLENRHNKPQPKKTETLVNTSVHELTEAPQKQEYSTPVSYSGNVEIIEMDRMRKMIAKHMVDSKHISAHVTSFAECDVTNLVLWREKIKKDYEKREGEKITFTPLFIEAIIKCIKKYPLLNSSVDTDRIIIKKDINIGMATALGNGNLIVPVIKNADQLNLTGLTKQVNNLANAARTNKLKPDDTSGGTFTLSNVGTFGSIMGTPIINQPQVAIMAVGAIKKRPVVMETEQGDSIAIRHMMYISLSYDHRIIDGALGSTFLNAVAKEFENFDGKRSY